MKAFVIRTGFGLENLAMEERPELAPSAGQVVVRVRAASLNYRDLMIAKGIYNPKLNLPRILGSDAAGEVTAIGEGVSKFVPGDRVVGCFMQSWISGPIADSAVRSALGGEREGVLAEYVVLDEQGLVHLPGTLSFEEAATLPCAAVTAWNALTGGECGPGKTVLLIGTGGVSVFALQFAKAMGARVLITSGHDEKLARVQELGATQGTNYRNNPDWDKWAREQTNGEGVDIVIEVGGAGTLERSVKAVRLGGHIALIGVLAGAGTFNPISVLMKAVRLQGVFVGSRVMFEAMNRLIIGEAIRPVIDRVFPFADTATAFRHLESGSHMGKIVVAM